MTTTVHARSPAAAGNRPAGIAAAELHPVTWALWLAAGLTTVLLTSNPHYVMLVALSAFVVYVSRRQARHRAIDLLFAAGVALSLLTVPLNLVTGSSGATHLFDLPTLSFPAWLASVTLGGPVTAESLVYAMAHAAAIAAILALVCSFNVSVDHFKLLKHTPAVLAQLGIVLTVSLLLIPETLKRLITLRESRIVRGYKSTLRSLPALLLPVLEESLERSVQRAESLDARGFGALSTPALPLETALAVAALGVSALSAFFYYYYPAAHVVSVAGIGVGCLGAGAVGWRQTRRAGATRLAGERVSATDRVVIGASVLGAAGMILSLALSIGGVGYLPFPTLTAPSFHPLPAVSCMLLLVPALMAPRAGR